MPATPFQTVVALVGLLLAGTVIKDLLLIAHTILIARLAQLGTFELRKLFYRRTLRMELQAFGREGTADLMSRFTNDMRAVNDGMVVLFGKMVREPLKMIACFGGAAWICWRLLLLSLIVAPVAGLLIRWLAKTLKRANRRAMEEMAQLYNVLEETFRGAKIVKAFTMERQERWRFHLNSKKYFQKAMRIARYDSLTRPVTEVMGILTICLALLAGAYLVLQGETHLFGIRMSQRPLSLASLLVFYGLLAGAADPLRKLSDVFTKLQTAAAASDRIYAKLDREPAIQDPPKPRHVGRHRRELVFDRIGFFYQPNHDVLKGIDLRVRFGETIALVGPNGCGKSTLVNLVPRFADPTSGEIRLDGVPIKEMRIRDLRQQIGIVTQETLLFNDTVHANIRYGNCWASDEAVVEAAERAQAHQFIQRDLPEGYQTIVGPGGNCLSGGQRQRIALARAILRDPAILILDEATSQMDLQSEHLMQRALEEFSKDRTTIIITHRLGLLRAADRIVVMEDGRILDAGRHDELLARCTLYHRLHQIQFSDLRESA
jgi:ABC-type multidrug transport system fused ATPase/permease subunit